jgi:hypothetical protein
VAYYYKLPLDTVTDMTVKELFNALAYSSKQKALDIDIQVKLVGDKKGYSGLQEILADEQAELHEEELSKVNTDERTKGAKELLISIADIRRANKKW